MLSAADIATRSAGFLRPDTLKARALVRPKDTDEVSKVVRWCHDNGMPIVTQGGLTGLVHGADASPEEVILSLERMRAIEAIDPVQRIAMVQAGVTLQALQEAVEAARPELSRSISARAARATLGGNAATNAGGNRVIRYGMMRDMVLGLEVVLADGTIVSSMNRLIKNNAGYDLKQLFIGSEGTLGVITRLVLRLREKPTLAGRGLRGGADVRRAAETAQAHATALWAASLSAFEVMWQSFYRLVTSPPARGKPPVGQDHPYYVLVESLGADRELDSERFVARAGIGAGSRTDRRRGHRAVRRRPPRLLGAARRRRAGRARRHAGRVRHLAATSATWSNYRRRSRARR